MNSLGALVILHSMFGAGAPSSAIAAVAYSPDGKFLAAGGYGEVRFIDVASGKVAHTLAAGPGTVTALAYARDGRSMAIAGGAAGKSADLRIVNLKDGLPGTVPAKTLDGHKDAVYSLAFSPDGKLLATAGYDRTVVLWEMAGTTPRPRFTLKDHSDSVYAVAFSPDGKLLASAAADRAVKVWDVARGERLYTLGDATDWLYAVAWHPDGKRLAAAGVDKSIRIWDVTTMGGTLKLTGFAHEAAINKLAFSPDGSTLYSLAEDRTLKSWDAGTLAERRLYARQPDTVLSLAVRPDGKHLALGRFDGALVILDPATSDVVSQPLPPKPTPPEIEKLTPDAAVRGKTTRIRFTGKRLDTVTAVRTEASGVTVRILPNGIQKTTIEADIELPASLPPGPIQLTFDSPTGAAVKSFIVDRFPSVDVSGPNDLGSTRSNAVDTTLVGAIERMGDVDYFRFECAAGQAVGVQTTLPAGSKLNATLEWLDASGRPIAESVDGSLGVVCPQAGSYTLAVRDRDYKGGKDLTYRIHVGAVPVVTGIYPLGLPRGSERSIQLEGVHLDQAAAKIAATAVAKVGSTLPLPLTSPHGPIVNAPTVVVGEFPENGDASIPVPGTANGRIESPGEFREWTFAAKKGQRLIVETHARRLRSPLDSWIEILTADGKPIERAVLRGVAKTVTVLNDRASDAPGFRLEAWNDFAIDDYLLIDQEMIRMRSLPKGPDDDIGCYTADNKRLAYFGTSPTAHALGSSVFKVTVHPPATRFSPNGLPLVTLYHRNDDGGPAHGKDSMVVFDPPADGTYRVRVGDSRGQYGKTLPFRLTIRPPKPEYSLSLSPADPKVWRGGGVPLTVTATRLDEFAGPIEVALTNLPPGFRSVPSVIEANQVSTVIGLWADADAKSPESAAFSITAKAMIDGQTVERTASGGKPATIDPGDILTRVEQREVVLKPGEETTFDVRIERHNGFTGRIPLEVRGLPHGVRVMNVGLNGILITERDTSRRVVLYAEPWVKPTERPFVVYAENEAKKTNHGAGLVMLKIRP